MNALSNCSIFNETKNAQLHLDEIHFTLTKLLKYMVTKILLFLNREHFAKRLRIAMYARL